MAEGLGDAGRQALRHEKGDRRLSAATGGDHAPHLDRWHRVLLDQGGCSRVSTLRSNKVGGNPSSTKRWYGVPRGTTDEVSSHVCLDLPTARPSQRSFHLVLESHDGRALAPISEEKHEPASDVDAAVVDSLKTLDPNRPIREADISQKSTKT